MQVQYARSEIHLSEIVDSVCEEFENYVQAREKTAERAVTIIRITTKSGGMNPLFGSVDIVPDEDLNKRLKFYVSLSPYIQYLVHRMPGQIGKSLPLT